MLNVAGFTPLVHVKSTHRVGFVGSVDFSFFFSV